MLNCAGGGTRTLTLFKAQGFESCVSAIPPPRQHFEYIKLLV